MRRMTRLLALPLLAVLGAHPGHAQRVEGSTDCALPGGCGTSGKPGGVERAPDTFTPATRGIRKSSPAAQDAAPATASPAAPVTAVPQPPTPPASAPPAAAPAAPAPSPAPVAK